MLSLITRNLTDASTDLKGILAAKIPKEQERVKSFRKSHGSVKVGEVTVEMVSFLLYDFDTIGIFARPKIQISC